MFGKSRMMLAATIGMGLAAYGAAAEVVRDLGYTFNPSATIGTSRSRTTPAGKRKGSTAAQQKRASLKKRNQARHKAVCRR